MQSVNRIFFKTQCKVYTEASVFYFSAHFFWYSFFFKYISAPRLETTKLSFKISLKDTSFRISLNSLRFYLSSEFLLNLCIPPCVGKLFQFMVFTFLENALNLCFFTHALVLHSKLQAGFFKNMFPPRRKGWRKLWFAFLNFN